MYPYIRQQNGTKLLMVDDKPFIMLAGEVHNSNSSSVEYMEGVYDQADRLGMNTLLLPVSWEQTEPREGVFDFSLVDKLILQARRRGKKLGLLWFGAWKNAQCYYAPEWVKTDLVRFARAQVEKGKNFIRRKDFYEMPYTTLSYLCDATREADAKAFAALIAHIRSIDETENTVITVQVENETGLMGTARENSDYADELFYGRVPQEFADYMKAHTETMVPDVREAVENGAARVTELADLSHVMMRKYCLLVRNHSMRGYSSVIRDAVNYIDFHIREPLSLKSIAEEVNISLNYLSAQFKKETGKTLTYYMNEKRIQSSLILLATTDLPIHEVAARVGIYDENYYARLFKKFQGQTAKQYRSMMRMKL